MVWSRRWGYEFIFGLASTWFLTFICPRLHFVRVIYVKGLGIPFFFQDIHGWGLHYEGIRPYHHNALDLIARPINWKWYKHMFDQAIVTVWSAPNYCYRYVRQYIFKIHDLDTWFVPSFS